MAVGIINVNGNHGISCNLVKESAYFQGFIFSGIEWFDPFCWKDSSQIKKGTLSVVKDTEYYVTTAFLNRHQASPNVNMAKMMSPVYAMRIWGGVYW